MDEMPKKPTGHVISHTHWDREWRWPIWTTRVRLIEFFKDLLDLMEREPAYRYFTLDGQSVMVEDYLDMVPEDRARIEQLVAGGRLFIGPWYTLPDPWPVAGECMVRNLLRGRRVTLALGEPLNVGYTTFGWGQPAQMPQIYARFGIDAIVTAKNVARDRAPNSEFLWRAPDGTEVFTTRLGELGRANFYKRALLKIIHGGQFWTEEWHSNWGKNGHTIRSASEEDQALDFHCLDSRPYVHEEYLRDALENAWSTTKDSLSETDRFLGDGCDYTGGLDLLPELIEKGNRIFEDRELKHSNLPDYIRRVRESIDPQSLGVVEGELRDPPITAVQGNALANRMHLKRLNRHAEDLLIHTAEPLSAMAFMLGEPWPRRFMERAWRYLLLSHSHDVINGVTVDKITRDALYRLDQVIEIAHVLSMEAMSGMTRRIDLTQHAFDDVLLVVFNPLPYPRREVLFAAMDTPREWDVARFGLINSEGERRPVQWIDRHEHMVPVHDAQARPRPFYTDRHTCCFDTGMVPACGYQVYRLAIESRQDRTLDFLYERIDQGSQVCDGGMGMKNEHLKVTFQSDGTFTLLDKATQRRFEGLNAFEDSAELGDYWHRTPANHDEVVSSRGFPHRIRIVRDGPLCTTFRIGTTLLIPARGDRAHRSRSHDSSELNIETEVSLKAGERRVEVVVRFENRAEDHRLRAVFPTHIKTDYSDAEGHFLVLRRPIALGRDLNGTGPGGMKTLPQHAFVDLSDGAGGLAFLNRGLTEFEVSEDDTRTVYLTLLRTAPMKICTEFRTPTFDPRQKGGQCLGHQVSEYALYPHDGDWTRGKVNLECQRYRTPLRPLQTTRHEDGKRPEMDGMLELKSGRVVLTGLKHAESEDSGWDMILRLNNPSEQDDMAELVFKRDIARAARLWLNEEEEAPLQSTAGRSMALQVRKGEILTIGLAFMPFETL